MLFIFTASVSSYGIKTYCFAALQLKHEKRLITKLFFCDSWVDKQPQLDRLYRYDRLFFCLIKRNELEQLIQHVVTLNDQSA